MAAHTALKVVQVMPRHANIVLTADAYVSVLPVVAHEAAWGTARLVLTAAAALGRDRESLTRICPRSAPDCGGSRAR
ncbi:hypothetical protein [Planobispora rosea]|nr:hypothetical protein [Planobispora rosea]